MSVQDRLCGIFVTVLNLGSADEARAVHRRGNADWDSFHHMELIAAIEEEFGVELTTDQIVAVEDFSSALTAVDAAGVPTDR